MEDTNIVPIAVNAMPAALQSSASLQRLLDAPLTERVQGLTPDLILEMKDLARRAESLLSGADDKAIASCLYKAHVTLGRSVPHEDALEGWFEALSECPAWALQEATKQIIKEVYGSKPLMPSDWIKRCTTLTAPITTAAARVRATLLYAPKTTRHEAPLVNPARVQAALADAGLGLRVVSED